MKTWLSKSGLTLSLVTATFLARSADQPTTSAPASTNGTGPKIQFDSTSYDFGRAVAGTQVKHDYVFTNVGDATLQITGVTPGCGCTTIGEWTHQVEPGKTGVIPIQFNTTMYNGPVSKAPSITCNDKAQPMVRFQLHGTVYKSLEISSTYLMFNIPPDGSQETNATVHIVNNDPEPLSLQIPTSDKGTFEAEIKTNVLGKNFDLVIKTVPPLMAGNNQAKITVGTSSKSSSTININVFAMVQPLMTAMPSVLTIPPGPITNSETLSLSLQNHGSHPIALSDPSVDAPGVETKINTTIPGSAYSVSVTFPSGFKVPVGKPMDLTVKTDNARFPTVHVPIIQAAAAQAAAPPPPAPKNVRVITQ